jgi:hypothetical protein
MGFPPKVKQKALRLSARHCSTCHRYKGIKMEVHHLVQEADGGPNTFENAIPLCFDCHSDAGHFNNRHPKGSKFSIAELTAARDNWYEFVSTNSMPEKLIISEHIQVSYYVLHTLEILEKVLKDDFSTLNHFRAKVYLSSNEVSSFWHELLKCHEKDFNWNVEQQLMIEVKQFKSLDEYCKEYQNVTIIEKDDDSNSYYEAKRPVDWEGILKMDVPKSFLSLLKKSGINISDVLSSILVFREDSCAGEEPIGYTEYLSVDPLSFIFIGITNASKKQIKLSTLKYEKVNQKLPSFNVLPREMIIIPIATATNMYQIEKESIRLKHIDGDRGVDFSRILNLNDFAIEDISIINGDIKPKSIIYNDNEGEFEVEVHKLDFHNLYSINSYWQCGSCPHLFFVNSVDRQYYVRELLISSSNKIGMDTFIIPSEIKNFIIRELEDEVTIIKKIIVNNAIVKEDIELINGEFIEIDVKSNDKVEIIGKYIPNKIGTSKDNDIWTRNYLVSKSNKSFNKEKNNTPQQRTEIKNKQFLP